MRLNKNLLKLKNLIKEEVNRQRKIQRLKFIVKEEVLKILRLNEKQDSFGNTYVDTDKWSEKHGTHYIVPIWNPKKRKKKGDKDVKSGGKGSDSSGNVTAVGGRGGDATYIDGDNTGGGSGKNGQLNISGGSGGDAVAIGGDAGKKDGGDDKKDSDKKKAKRPPKPIDVDLGDYVFYMWNVDKGTSGDKEVDPAYSYFISKVDSKIGRYLRVKVEYHKFMDANKKHYYQKDDKMTVRYDGDKKKPTVARIPNKDEIFTAVHKETGKQISGTAVSDVDLKNGNIKVKTDDGKLEEYLVFDYRSFKIEKKEQQMDFEDKLKEIIKEEIKRVIDF